MVVTLKIEGQTIGKGRQRTGKYSIYTPDKTRAYEYKVRTTYIERYGAISFHDKPIIAKITVYCKVPSSYSKAVTAKCLKGEVFPTKKPDCDNIAKIILDSLNGLAYNDDKQIVELRVQKKYAPADFVIVSLLEASVQV